MASNNNNHPRPDSAVSSQNWEMINLRKSQFVSLKLGSSLSASRSGTCWRSNDQGPSVRNNFRNIHEVVGNWGKAVLPEEQVAHSLIDMSKKKRTTDQFILVRRDQTPPDSTTGPSSQHDDDTIKKANKVIHESSSTSDSERTESETETAAPKDDKDQGEVDSSTVTSGVSIPISDPVKAHEALAGPDPEPMKEDQTGSDSGKLHVSLAGPNPEHMDDEFLSTVYSIESVKNQESEKSEGDITAKKEQMRKTRSNLLISHMNKKNLPTKHDQLPSIHASHEALIADEDAMDKEVADNITSPSAGSNQGRSTKRRRSDSATSGSAKPPLKADDQSSKKPRESEASASKQHPTLSSIGWQITDTRDAGADYSMHRSLSRIWTYLKEIFRCQPQ
ncbi:hypothetical protein Tco_1108747 [Tanacetum coccineum]